MDNIQDLLAAQLNNAFCIGNETSRVNFEQSYSTTDKIRQIEETLYYSRRFIEERISNLNLLDPSNSAVRLVSLGEACMARTLATRWGLKASKKLGEKTHPFDLSVHPAPCIPALLASNFCNYLDLEDLSIQPDKKTIFNKRHSISFNHDYGRYNTEALLPAFVSAQMKRVENLKADTESSEHVVFLIYRDFSDTKVFRQALLDLKFSLAKMKEVKKYTIIALNSGPEISGPEFRAVNSSAELIEADTTNSGTTIVANIRTPFPGYTFYNPRHLFTSQGFNFEMTIADIIKKVISANLSQSKELKSSNP